jgi:hypothetical protein
MDRSDELEAVAHFWVKRKQPWLDLPGAPPTSGIKRQLLKRHPKAINPFSARATPPLDTGALPVVDILEIS